MTKYSIILACLCVTLGMLRLRFIRLERFAFDFII